MCARRCQKTGHRRVALGPSLSATDARLGNDRRASPEPWLEAGDGSGEGAADAKQFVGELLGLDDVEESALYNAMDWRVERQSAIEEKLAKRHPHEGTLVLYDLSSSSYAGRCCPPAQQGYSRERKRGFPQINYGRLCDREGCPTAIEVFEGNSGDPATLATQLAKLRDRFGLKRVIIVGDRGMLTSARIREELADEEGLDGITALGGPAIRKLVEAGDLGQSLFDDRELAEISSSDFLASG